MTKTQYMTKAGKLTITINGKVYEADPKEFSTGNLGYTVIEKIKLTVDGVEVNHQIGFNLTAIKSKDWADGEQKAA